MKMDTAPVTWHNYTEVKATNKHTVVGCLKVLDGLYIVSNYAYEIMER